MSNEELRAIVLGGKVNEVRRSDLTRHLFIQLTEFMPTELVNGWLPEELGTADVIVWMPDFNCRHAEIVENWYPKKKKGAVLICSKVLDQDTKLIDAMAYIFETHSNAVITITHGDDQGARYELIDALGNTWASTKSYETLARHISLFTDWTRGSIRLGFSKVPNPEFNPARVFDPYTADEFIKLNNKLASDVTHNTGKRFFGNLSTRCTKLFPSWRHNAGFLVSPRNIDKSKLSFVDFVYVTDGYQYAGNRKPSVDTPVQMAIYQMFSDVNFMIHGHAFIRDAPTTNQYYPCGDCREIPEIAVLFAKGYRAINLKNHGFIVAARSLAELSYFIDIVKFT